MANKKLKKGAMQSRYSSPSSNTQATSSNTISIYAK